jgi:hypothetical protein
VRGAASLHARENTGSADQRSKRLTLMTRLLWQRSVRRMTLVATWMRQCCSERKPEIVQTFRDPVQKAFWEGHGVYDLADCQICAGAPQHVESIKRCTLVDIRLFRNGQKK